jgi:hypothetical protein
VAQVPFNEETKLRAYPVPTNDQLTLDGLAVNQTLYLFDVQGILLANYPVSNETMSIDLSKFQNKVFIFVQGNNTLRVLKN